MRLRAGFASDRGLVRPVNEDTYFLRRGLYAVCDGMGGARGGEVASQMACFGLHGVDPATAGRQELRQAVEEANRNIVMRSAGEDHLMGMGTTLTAALIREGRLILAHVGDSRAYLLRDGDLDQLTEDHSWVGEMVRRGDLTPAQAAIHPHRSVITRALGTDGDIEPDLLEMDVLPGDRIMLCSDGLTGMVPDTDILELLAGGDDAQRTADLLVKAALVGGGEDNVTVVIIDVTGEDESTEAVEESGILASQILFGPNDRGHLPGLSHRGARGSGVRDRFGRRITPPTRPVAPRAAAENEPRQVVAPPSEEGPREPLAALDVMAEAEEPAGDEPAEVVAAASAAASAPAALLEDAGALGGVAAASRATSDTASGATSDSAATVELDSVGADTGDETTGAAAGVATDATRGVAGLAGETKRAKPRLRLGFALLLVIVVALAIAVSGFAYYNSTIYYVGTYDDGTVALYRGLPGALLGIELSRVVLLGDAKYDSLSSMEQRRVDAHSLVSQEEGQRLLGSLGP